ncbi:hypothetical protein CYMTET_53899 [Cymbomonas tetramitiformis]|uniref:DUF4461 domain-containing protein n=1 Tax=Cymbomonas tetramitiformis TaxID=36881 RepID=A0AAE0BGB9_9CHLO|nr:hypothetical protein CYMTET_53899 [Cymbomonas tetramitiformis]
MRRGTLFLPVNAPVDDMYRFLGQRGAQSDALVRRHEEMEREHIETRESVRKILRLRRLVCHREVTYEQFKKCCDRLLHDFDLLRDHMDSQSIRVARANGLSSCGTYIDIPWDFSL